VSLNSKEYIWGSNSLVANYGVQLLVTNVVQPNQRYVDTALDNLHYCLAQHAFALVVTQSATIPSAIRIIVRAPRTTSKSPGRIALRGPNHAKQDPAMRKLPDNLPPAKMYLDEGSFVREQRGRHQLERAARVPARWRIAREVRPELR